MKLFFDTPAGRLPRAAIFLSGSGSNAERILERGQRTPGVLDIVALVTDCPRTSRAGEIGARFDVPVIDCDIRAFYRSRGLSRISLRTPAERDARAAWTDELRQRLVECQIDFGLFAGFVPLTNIAGDFPCLNVHPGDLTYLKGGDRYLVGLHTVPIERAILEGLEHLRSSVIIVEPYTGRGDNMDSGVILGMSEKVSVELERNDVDALRAVAAARTAERPCGGHKDVLEAIAEGNLERLKIQGDWVVFPQVALDFAAGRFASDESGGLLYRDNGDWQAVETIVYGQHASAIRQAGA